MIGILPSLTIVLIYTSLSSGGERTQSFGSQFLPPGIYEHVILTPAVYKDTFQILANWRTKRGIPSRVFCIESTNVYPGRDLAEKMRNFLRDADTTWGLNFAFIARQDHPARQYRNCFVSFSAFRDTLPCDLYYSDLHRRGASDPFYDWDANKNNIFGEVADSIDYWSDIYVGMITLDNVTQASTYLQKLLRHERNPDTLYSAKALLVSCATAGDQIFNRVVDAMPIPPWKYDKMYTSGNGNEIPTAAKFKDSINGGYGYSAHIGHGDINNLAMPDNYTANHIGQQTNINKLSTLIAVGSNCGAFDRAGNCIAETMIVAKAGFINLIMNARDGWMGLSEYYVEHFFYKFLPPKIGYPCSALVYIGQVLAHLKDQWIYRYPRPGQADTSGWLWETYQKNLFGDPAGVLHNWSPLRTMTVTHQSQIRIGPQDIAIFVTVDGAPLESVLVCLWKGTEVYARGYTNAGGSVTLHINPTTIGVMLLTCTRRNYLTYEGSVNVVSEIVESNNQPLLPAYFALENATPNPFKRSTVIKYQLPRSTHTRLVIYDATGRKVKTLVNKTQLPGYYSAVWDKTDDNGIVCASGIYFCRFEACGFTKAITLVKLQ